jgi:hypothetical protein
MLASASLRCRVVAARVVLTMLTLVPRNALLVRNPPARRGRRSPLQICAILPVVLLGLICVVPIQTRFYFYHNIFYTYT